MGYFIALCVLIFGGFVVLGLSIARQRERRRGEIEAAPDLPFEALHGAVEVPKAKPKPTLPADGKALTTYRRPSSSMWKKRSTTHISEDFGFDGGVYQRGSLTVMTSVAEKGHMRTYEVAVSRKGDTPSDADMAVVRRDFGMYGAAEPFKHPNRVRGLYLTIDTTPFKTTDEAQGMVQ